MKHTRVFRDSNHLPIVADLRRDNYGVIDCAALGQSIPDIVVANQDGNTALVEIKLPEGRFYLSQLVFLAKWQGYCGFAQTTQDAKNIVDSPDDYSLNKRQREVILGIVAEDLTDVGRRGKASLGKEQITVKKFERLFEEKYGVKIDTGYE